MQRSSRFPVAIPRIVHRDRDIVVADLEHLCIVIWHGAVTPAPFEKQRAALADVVARHPNRAGFLIVIEDRVTPPSEELRHKSTEMLKSHGESLRCVGCVIEGNGFRAAITRGVLSGMILLMRNSKSKVSFFADVPSAAAWMGAYVNLPSVDALTSMVKGIRAELIES
jgi:hypothetical protein